MEASIIELTPKDEFLCVLLSNSVQYVVRKERIDNIRGHYPNELVSFEGDLFEFSNDTELSPVHNHFINPSHIVEAYLIDNDSIEGIING